MDQDLDDVIAEMLAAVQRDEVTGYDSFAVMVMAVLKTRLRLKVEIGRRPHDERPSSYQCKVELVLLAKPSEFRDETGDTDTDLVICEQETDFSVPSV
jgi:hypothetical protein